METEKNECISKEAKLSSRTKGKRKTNDKTRIEFSVPQVLLKRPEGPA